MDQGNFRKKADEGIMFKELVEHIVTALVDFPDQVTVQEISGTASVVLEVRVAEDDIGRVIGRNGRVINAIRTILQALAAKEGKRVTVEIL